MREELKPEIKQSCLEFAKVPVTAGITWNDVTSYSKYDAEKVPTTFETKIGDCRILIIMGHIHYPNIWIMNCHDLNIKEKMLQCVTAEEAAHLAISYCKAKVQKLHEAFSSCD